MIFKSDLCLSWTLLFVVVLFSVWFEAGFGKQRNWILCIIVGPMHLRIAFILETSTFRTAFLVGQIVIVFAHAVLENGCFRLM